MSTFEIIRRDGSIARMQLNDATDPQAEVDKWSDANDVVEIRAVDGFNARPPQRLIVRANQIATGGAEYVSEVECTVAELAELNVNRAIATDARAPNEDAGKGTGMLVFRSAGVWKTSAGTPVSA